MLERASVLDTVSYASQRDTCLVLPTLKHAVALWNMYCTAFSERHGLDNLRVSKTAIVMMHTKTILRLWVPYEREPTMVMDNEVFRKNYELVTPYDKFWA